MTTGCIKIFLISLCLKLRGKPGLQICLFWAADLFIKNLSAEESDEYLKDALHASECPVLVVPEKFDFPESNILAFDGSESSVYAIKQFVYMFPGAM